MTYKRKLTDEFVHRLSPEILLFGEAMAKSFQKFPALNRVVGTDNEQFAQIDNLYGLSASDFVVS